MKWEWLNVTENLGRTYEITVTQEKEAEDRRWRVDTDKFMGGRQTAGDRSDVCLMEAFLSLENTERDCKLKQEGRIPPATPV